MEEKNRPIHEIRYGIVRAGIWINHSSRDERSTEKKAFDG